MEIPYFSQWESSNLVDDILHYRIPVSDDPLWRKSGVENLEEYDLWARNICGMTCVKMILKKELDIEIPLIKTAKESMSYGCYIPQEKTVDGLFYKPLVKFLQEKFGLKSRVVKRLDLSRIKKELSKNNYVIASVSPEIRDVEQTITKSKGGHLVLITGFNNLENTISLHNPSGYYQKSQRNFTLGQDVFQKYFAGRGIVVYSLN